MWRTLLTLSLFLLVPAPLGAQEPEEDPVPVPFDEPVEDEAKKPEPELHKIYVPYSKLNEVFGTDKERVMVPYK